jgi:hypothetical protein
MPATDRILRAETLNELAYYHVTCGGKRNTLVLFAETREDGRSGFYLTANGQRIRPCEELCNQQKAREWFRGIVTLYVTSDNFQMSLEGSSLS